LQSLLSTHAPPTSIFFASLQPTKSHNEVIIKPGTRNRDADISILQFRHREKWAPESYHNGSFMVKSRVKDAAHDWGSTAAAWGQSKPGASGAHPRKPRISATILLAAHMRLHFKYKALVLEVQ